MCVNHNNNPPFFPFLPFLSFSFFHSELLISLLLFLLFPFFFLIFTLISSSTFAASFSTLPLVDTLLTHLEVDIFITFLLSFFLNFSTSSLFLISYSYLSYLFFISYFILIQLHNFFSILLKWIISYIILI